MGDKTKGLYRKFSVHRTDDPAGLGKHSDCDYFVLDMTHDVFAPAALRAYADACEAEYPLLAADLREKYALTHLVTDEMFQLAVKCIAEHGSLLDAIEAALGIDPSARLSAPLPDGRS